MAKLFFLPAFAATLQPPLQTMRNPEFTLIAAERLDQAMIEQRIRVQVLERLRGDAAVPDEIELLILDRDDAYILPGQPYLLVYSDVQRVPGKPRTLVRNPDRRVLLHIDGADPAVFPDTARNRELLSISHHELETSDNYIETLIGGLALGSPPEVDLWSAELAIRPAFFEQLGPDDLEVVRNVANNPQMRPASRARLLLAALDASPNLGVHWYAASAQAILKQTSTQLELAMPGMDHLIYTALLIAQTEPDPQGRVAVQKWLQSTPPLAENAALALRAIDPVFEVEAVTLAIEHKGTPEVTRQMLKDYLRRLKRMRLSSPNA